MQIFKLILLLPLLFFGVIINSCKKSENINTEVIESPVDVYVSGYYINNNIVQTACYWKNGEHIPVIDQSIESRAYDILVDNGIVYMAGVFNDKPCYWANGERKDLDPTNQLYSGFTYGMLMYQGTLYIVGGGKFSVNDELQAILWKKTSQNDLEMIPSSIPNSLVGNLAIKDGQPYIPGTFNGKPGYWLNDWNTRYDLPNEIGLCFFVSIYNGTIYLSGFKNINGNYEYGYWSGNTNLFTPLNFSAEDGVVSQKMAFDEDGQIYFAGCQNDPQATYKAVYWKNSLKKQLEPESTIETKALAISLNGSHTYIAGYKYINGARVVGYWKDENWVGFDTPNSVAPSAIYLLKK